VPVGGSILTLLTGGPSELAVLDAEASHFHALWSRSSLVPSVITASIPSQSTSRFG